MEEIIKLITEYLTEQVMILVPVLWEDFLWRLLM